MRIIKTRKNLYESLLYLLKEKTFEEIKVSDICEKALINRSTFYAHYNDKYELFADLISTLKTSLSEELTTNPHISNSKEYYLEMLKIFLNHVDSKREIYSAIIAKFYLGAVFNVGTEWLRNSNHYTKQEILEYLEKLIPKNI